ncbi:MAG: methyltransferase, partial [Myxococcota bacterium]|nr:methyltransferase [Myxococcota bacterium]
RALWGLEGQQLWGFETDCAALALARTQLPGARIAGQDFLTTSAGGTMDLVVGNPPYLRRRGLRRDLYVDFIERSVDQLRDGGHLGLVLSNAWLSVGYGREVQQLLLRRCAVEWILESTVERWFEGASVNTMVLIARRCDDAEARARQAVAFAELREPLPAAPTVVREVLQSELVEDAPWALQLRAPDRYLDLCSSKATVPLGELARLQRGHTTNDNAFFYPPEDAGIEETYLAPLLKGPRDSPGLRVQTAELSGRVFLCNVDRETLKNRGEVGALNWVNSHRAQKEASSWSLRSQESARLFLVKGYHDRFRQPRADEPVQADQQLYLVHPRPGVDELVLAGLLNSSWFQLALELTGRVNFGDGVLWLGLSDARERLMVPDLRCWTEQSRQELATAYLALPSGPVPPEARMGEDPLWARPRARLDEVVAATLGLQMEDYRALAQCGVSLCRRRLTLAASSRRPG